MVTYSWIISSNSIKIIIFGLWTQKQSTFSYLTSIIY